jgi:hypothetical protein
MPALTKAQRGTLLEAFALFDGDRDGRITVAGELSTVLRASGFLLTNAELAALSKALLPRYYGFLTPLNLLEVAASLPPSSYSSRTPEQTLEHLRQQLRQGVLAQPNQTVLLCKTGEPLTAREYASLSLVQSYSFKYGSLPLGGGYDLGR